MKKRKFNHTSNSHQEEISAVGELLFSPPRRFPTLLDMLALVGLFLLSSLVGTLSLIAFGCELPVVEQGVTLYPETWGRSLFINYLFQMGFMLLSTLLYRRLRHASGPIAHFSIRGLNPLVLLWGVVAMLSLSILIDPLLHLIPEDLFPEPEIGRGIWALLSAVVLAPLFEELLCRGILLESLYRRYGVATAWFGSSLFFAIMHLHPAMMLNAFILGLFFGFLAIRFRSLWPSILLHAFNNGLALLMMWTEMPGEHFGGRPMADLTLFEFVGSPQIYWTIYLVALLIVAWSTWRILVHIGRIKREEKKKRSSEEIISSSDTLISGKKA